MAKIDLENLILIVAGSSFRAEEMDRPMAYQLTDEIGKRLGPDSPWRALVVSDVLYINDKRMAKCPTISIGGPGVNCLSALMYCELDSVLTIDNVLLIQMDVELQDLRCCLWGMDHDQTVEALNLFLKRGHLDHFLFGVTGEKTLK